MLFAWRMESTFILEKFGFCLMRFLKNSYDIFSITFDVIQNCLKVINFAIHSRVHLETLLWTWWTISLSSLIWIAGEFKQLLKIQASLYLLVATRRAWAVIVALSDILTNFTKFMRSNSFVFQKFRLNLNKFIFSKLIVMENA